MTKKQREVIYRQAAENILMGVGFRYCCIQIAAVANGLDHRFTYSIAYPETFPEFFVMEEMTHYPYWWGRNEVEPRVIALLFAAEMCKD